MGGPAAQERQLIAAKQAEERQRRGSSLRLRWEPMTTAGAIHLRTGLSGPLGSMPSTAAGANQL